MDQHMDGADLLDEGADEVRETTKKKGLKITDVSLLILFSLGGRI
jgi:hypothetical protein